MFQELLFQKHVVLVGKKGILNSTGAEYFVDFLPKIKIELALPDDDMVERAIDAICKAAYTEDRRWKIFVYDLQQVVRIRTGEVGADALS